MGAMLEVRAMFSVQSSTQCSPQMVIAGCWKTECRLLEKEWVVMQSFNTDGSCEN